MVLITGAAGKTGRAMTKAFARQGMSVRAFVRRSEQAERVRALGANEIQVGDLTSKEDIRKALQGIDAVYHIAPNMNPHESTIGFEIIAAARDAGVEKFVFHSVLHPQTQVMAHHWNKLLVEERLFESGLRYAIVQPTAYMQNLLANRDAIRIEGVYRIPYPALTVGNLVDLHDVAEAAARILQHARLDYGIYELVGTPPMTQEEIAQIAGQVLEREVRVEEIPLDVWRANAEEAGVLSVYAVETLSAMFRYYADFGLTGSTFVLESILGRPPRSLKAFFESAFSGV